MAHDVSRRDFLVCSMAASGGLAAGLSLEERVLLAEESRKPVAREARPSTPLPSLPTGKIRHVEMTRLILGGNLIGGVAHSRDLRYISTLVTRYFTDEKILDTWAAAEANGINTMAAWPSNRALGLLDRYRRERGGKIQWLGHTGCERPFTGIKSCIDHGAIGIYIAGDKTETFFREHRLDELGEAIDLIKKNGLIAGIACHAIAVPKTCEEAGIAADFYMKTLHSGDYWSATPPEQCKQEIRELDPGFVADDHTSGQYHDNMWCIRPDETIATMRTISKPWMAFKVLAAGAIPPAQGFGYAFRNGADFVHVGMFDFQIADDCELTRQLCTGELRRDRPWRA